jgi:hypothetical protein
MISLRASWVTRVRNSAALPAAINEASLSSNSYNTFCSLGDGSRFSTRSSQRIRTDNCHGKVALRSNPRSAVLTVANPGRPPWRNSKTVWNSVGMISLLTVVKPAFVWTGAAVVREQRYTSSLLVSTVLYPSRHRARLSSTGRISPCAHVVCCARYGIMLMPSPSC